MSKIEEIIQSGLPAGKAGMKPKEKQTKLVEAVVSGAKNVYVKALKVIEKEKKFAPSEVGRR